jgi:hypothetical protein
MTAVPEITGPLNLPRFGIGVEVTTAIESCIKPHSLVYVDVLMRVRDATPDNSAVLFAAFQEVVSK